MKKLGGLKAARSLLALIATIACGDDGAEGTGDVSVLLEAEEALVEGLDPGDEGESIRDGWQVRFDKYIISIGAIDVHLASDERVRASAPEMFVVELKAIPPGGLPLWNLGGLRSGRWQFNFSSRGGADGTTRHDSVSAADFAQLQAGDFTHLIAGTLSKNGGQSCPPASLAAPPSGASPSGQNAGGDACYSNAELSFAIGINAEVTFGPCEIDGIPGFSVAAGSSGTVAATIHGDHLFFNGFPEGDEGGVMRLAQWLADSDLDLNGAVTEQELKAIAPSSLPELDTRYQLGGSPIRPLDNMWTYIRAQLETQGHMDGEGECAFEDLVD